MTDFFSFEKLKICPLCEIGLKWGLTVKFSKFTMPPLKIHAKPLEVRKKWCIFATVNRKKNRL